ncbi:MAG TPA: class E sortase [Candidatus Aquicultor sp.]|jgi:LPXTG-site transpeptidase (sortase) family protein
MAIQNKNRVVLRISGLSLIATGALILTMLFSTDLSSIISQKRLSDEWNTMERHSKQPTTSSTMRVGIIPPCILETPTAHKRTATKQLPERIETPDLAQKRLNREKAQGLGLRTTVHHKAVAHLSPFARIEIPKINLDAIVVQGVDDAALALGPGHMEETAWPGDVGNMVISGHRVTHSHPFYYINELKSGDPIHVYNRDRERFTYYVQEQKVVVPTDLSVIEPASDKTLTLSTCNPRFSAATRLIIVAKMPLVDLP